MNEGLVLGLLLSSMIIVGLSLNADCALFA